MTRPVTEDLALRFEKSQRSRPTNPDHDALRKVMGGRIETQSHLRRGKKYRHKESSFGMESPSVLDVADPVINTGKLSVPLFTSNLLGQNRPGTLQQRRPQAHVPQVTPQPGQDQSYQVSTLLREAQQRSAAAAALGQANGPLSDQERLAMMPQSLDHVAKQQLLKVPEQNFRQILANYMTTQRRNSTMQNRLLPGGGSPTPGQRNMPPFQQPEMQLGMAGKIHQTTRKQRNDTIDRRGPLVRARGLNLTQEQLSKLTPAQQAAVKHQMLKAQGDSRAANGQMWDVLSDNPQSNSPSLEKHARSGSDSGPLIPVDRTQQIMFKQVFQSARGIKHTISEDDTISDTERHKKQLVALRTSVLPLWLCPEDRKL